MRKRLRSAPAMLAGALLAVPLLAAPPAPPVPALTCDLVRNRPLEAALPQLRADGEVTVSGKEACVVRKKRGSGCDFRVRAAQEESFGPGGTFRLARLQGEPGAKDGIPRHDLFVWLCEKESATLVFSGRFFGPTAVAVKDGLRFEVTSGEWGEADTPCCPSLRKTQGWRWDAGKKNFFPDLTRVEPVPPPKKK